MNMPNDVINHWEFITTVDRPYKYLHRTFIRKLFLYFRKKKQSQSGHANKTDITTTSTLLQ